jgi:ribosomal protein S21
MPINVEIKRKDKENNLSALKRFGRKVQESGVIKYSKSLRYAERNESNFVKKKNRLNSIRKKAEIEKQIKLGKMTPRGRGRR